MSVRDERCGLAPRLMTGFVLALGLTVSLAWNGDAQQRPAAAAPSEADTFTGKSDRLDSAGMNISRRSFDPGARSYWHSHERGQLILVQEGRGRVQQRGKPMRELGPGETDFVPPGIEHWHGATPDTKLTQLAVNFGGSIAWGAPVTPEEYSGRGKPGAK